MKKLTISYGRTLSDKDFGSFRADCTAELREGECAHSAMNVLKDFVLGHLNEERAVVKNAAQAEMPLEKTEKAEEAPAPKKAAKKVAKKAVKKVANVAYDRNLKPHKTMFLEIATKLGLRDDVSENGKAALKGTSEFMEGKEMFKGGTTDILTEFKELCQSTYMGLLKNTEDDV